MISKYYTRLIKVDLRSGNVNIYTYRSAVKNIKFGSMTPSDLYKLPDLDKRADSGAVSVYIYPASGQRGSISTVSQRSSLDADCWPH